MIAINPDDMFVKDDGSEFEVTGKGLSDAEIEKLKGNVSIHQKWGMTIPEMDGTAYIRISPQLRDFLILCNDKHGVIGFEYDFEDPGLNFGIILKKGAANV